MSNNEGLVGRSREEKGPVSSRNSPNGLLTLSMTGRIFVLLTGPPFPFAFVLGLRCGSDLPRDDLGVAGPGGATPCATCAVECDVVCVWCDSMEVWCFLLVCFGGANGRPPLAEIPTTRLVGGFPSSWLRTHHAEAATQHPSMSVMRPLLMAGPFWT